MIKVVLQAVLFSGAALFFVFAKSDGLRTASQTGDISALAEPRGAEIHKGAGINWAQYDPRALWNNRPKFARLNVKTVQATPAATVQDPTALLAAKGINPAEVTIIKLD
ncbi:hypothetical protein EDD53_1625 [Pacificibacter maritimus]|uniref:Uncharacterized protein n=1 Tax=Pacificibacter maritimus TaxID=762213 RepID=A0A3N4V039_9RHOB|nr:hypothetical protein [Pacificibacter maritimus]RPE67220.1 hypothetical protein EDD53_1625 [Pacificibacter maritimus]